MSAEATSDAREIRQALLRQAATEAEEATAASPRLALLLFTLGGEAYAFRLGDVREVVKPTSITPVPSVPAHILGVMNLRGEILPVLDPKGLLGLEGTASGSEARIIVTRTPRGPVGFLVDEVEDAVEAEAGLEPLLHTLPEARARYLEGQLSIGGRLVGLLQLSALLVAAGSPREG